MRALVAGTLAITILACNSEPKSASAPASPPAPAPAAGSGSAAAAPPPAPSAPAKGSAPAPAAGSGSAAAAAAPDAPPDPKLITRTSFGPYKAGEKVTQKLLESKFGWRFKSEDSFVNEESGETVPARWMAQDGEDIPLRVDKSGARWVAWHKGFHDARGIGPGTPAATLIEKIADLKCVEIQDEEPEFQCWSAAAPELRYCGLHGYELKDGFTKKDIAKSKLKIDYLEWRPKAKK
jgi:hypothetical protein